MNERLHPWWRTMPPHRDIAQNKRLDASIFAADLAQVVRGNAPDDYQDPARFFATTYLSDGLRDLTTRVLRELAGVGADNRIVQIDTPFGGGKTHTLLTLYHLVRSPEVVRGRPELAALVAEAGLPAVPDAAVATVIGTESSAAEVVEYADGTRAHTLWGQIAHGLGGRAAYDLLREADERRVAPGVSTLVKILAPRPALVLIDELVNYIVGAAGIAVGDSTLKDQTISFLQQLTAAVSQTPRSVLLLTIPASQTELYGGAADSLRQQTLFTAARQIGDIAGRVLTVTTPVRATTSTRCCAAACSSSPPTTATAANARPRPAASRRHTCACTAPCRTTCRWRCRTRHTSSASCAPTPSTPISCGSCTNAGGRCRTSSVHGGRCASSVSC